MTAYFDNLETRPPEEREARLMEALPEQVARARETPGHPSTSPGMPSRSSGKCG